MEKLEAAGAEMMRPAQDPIPEASERTTKELAARKPNDANWDKYRARYIETFHAIADTADTLGINMVSVIFPSAPPYGKTFSSSDFDRISEELLKERQVPFVHLRAAFGMQTDPRLLYLVTPFKGDALGAPAYPSDGHLSRYGNIIAGRAVGSFLSTLTE